VKSYAEAICSSAIEATGKKRIADMWIRGCCNSWRWN